MKEHNILGVILAGGKSSRFGSNKSLYNLNVTFIQSFFLGIKSSI